MFDFIGDNLAAIILTLAGLVMTAFISLQFLQVSRLNARIDMLTGGAEGDLEAVLAEHLEIVHEVGRDLDELTARTAVMESTGRHHYARLGLVRFSPFKDTGGDQSFALALLDESDDGFVISSLHSRTGTRIYAKAVANGKADMTLSAEEVQAIDQARTRRNLGPAATGRAAAGRTKAAAAAAVAEAARPSAVVDATPAPAEEARAAKPAPIVKAVVGAKVAPPPAIVPTPKQAPVVRAKVAPAVAAPVAPVAELHDDAVRPVSERIKGQSKSGVAIDHSAADAEKSGRKPGHRSTPGAE
jgi:hypothetical protein